jgi:hypothetical protein
MGFDAAWLFITITTLRHIPEDGILLKELYLNNTEKAMIVPYFNCVWEEIFTLGIIRNANKPAEKRNGF